MNEKMTDKQLEEAARWSARLFAPDCSDRDRAEFERWVRSDPSHADAFAAAQIISDGVGLLAEVDPRLQEMADEAYAMGDSDLMLAPARRARRLRWQVPLALAASLLVAVGVVKLSGQDPVIQPGDLYTASSEPRSVTLSDGSTVRLDIATRIRVTLSADARKVELLDGRAIFEVAHDSSRPFSVSAAASRTTALGTRFQVQRDDSMVTVTLSQGSVAVTDLDASRNPGARNEKLAPGEQLRINTQPAGIWTKRQVDSDMVTSWAHGRLVFRATPLAEAIAEVNRYSSTKLTLGDVELSGLFVSGNFIPGDGRSTASAFAAVLPIRIVEAQNEILLFRRYDEAGG